MKMNLFLSFLMLLLLCVGCNKAKDNTVDIKDTTTLVINPTVPLSKANYDLSLLETCVLFNETPVVTNFQQQNYLELSGLAPSRNYPGILFVHEDSGNGNEVYITNTKGEDFGKIILDGVYNRDWEDIKYGPGPDNSKKYIYVAEIGDNDSAYPGISIFRFPEPDLIGLSSKTILHVTPEKLQFVYPKGSFNAETLLLDPATKDFYILTKQVAQSTLYVARYPQSTTSVTTLTPLGTFSFDMLTSGDISLDEIIVRNTGQIWYWKRLLGETIVTTMLRKPQDAPYARNERQGEAICFSGDGSGYYTTSEVKKFLGDKAALSFYKRK